MNDVSEQNVDEVMAAYEEAEEMLGLLVQRFACQRPDISPAMRLLGLEVALLRAAARQALIAGELFGAPTPRASYLTLARQQYDSAKRYATKLRPRKPAKRAHLRVVK
jgi:hypothetical protein